MTDEELLRYARHILLPQIGVDGQQAWLRARALIVGAGGLGSPAAMYLAAAGVGRIELVDSDQVELSNLQRQIAHTSERIGQLKVDSAARTLAQLNPGVQVTTHARRADPQWLRGAAARADVVLDCSDNFATRQAVNLACVQTGTPLVSGAAVGFDGQISVFDSRQPDAPCYACAFAPDAEPPQVDCASMGVFAPLVGIVGAMQAAEALKLLAGIGQSLAGRLLLLDARSMRCSEVQLPRLVDCPVCAGMHKP